MADFLAGQKLTALHFPPTVGNVQNDSFTFDSGTFGIDADSGTYIDCGTSFVACFTGRATILYDATLDHSTTASTEVAPVVRTGGTVGAGSVVLAASSDNAVRNVGTDDRRYGAHYLLSGLTAGSTYNVRLEHRTSGASATVQRRSVTVKPAT